ncbi:MAG: shikimate dehydrogenase [Candidatus Caldarchaeum sp.]
MEKQCKGRELEKKLSIAGTTAVYGIFGYPVSHSLSPIMHNAAFSALCMDSVYVAFNVVPDELEVATKAIRALGISGINVTIPHKQSIMPFLDEVSDDAKLVGAVNTVLNDCGVLRGFNTDVRGFLLAVEKELGFRPEGNIITVLGAGGAARAVISGVSLSGAKRVYILNRTPERAQRIAEEFRTIFRAVEFHAGALAEAPRYLPETDLLVNSTSAGMKGASALPIDLGALKHGASVYDLVYVPTPTPLVAQAKGLGFKAASGLGMLIFQGAESFEIWTGRRAPTDVMEKAITLALEL